jgi:hypothetical protein
MWQIENRTPFAADRGWVRGRDGGEIWLVALKCTFDILEDGSTRISDDQPPVTRAPVYHGEPGASSIKYETDLVLTKTTTDITLLGNACAPPGQSVTQMDVGFRVGQVQKWLRVYGDRVWETLRPSVPKPFSRMPLVYERAYGGVDPHSRHPERDWEPFNPVGVGFVTSGNLKGRAVPNIVYPDDADRDRPRPAGFGPVASHWRPRVGFAGTYDDRWQQTRQPLLPEDFDDRFFQCAPADQQAPGFMRGGEPVALRGMSLRGPIDFMLPRVFPGFETRFFDGSRKVHTMRQLHSIILEPEQPRVSLVWHSALPCHSKVQKLDRTTVTLKENVGRISAAGSADVEPA